MNTAADILFEHQGAVGVITLNRPKALNALNRDMCLALKQQLDRWALDAAVQAVVIQGAGDRAFCAGGDVVALYNSGKEGTSDWEDFFASEYRMNAAIGAFPKPYIALIDGVVMGGGVGVSVHGDFRVATERTLFAMPETGIGLIPDVGGGYFMPRLAGETGMYLALTGQRLNGADCHALGIATHYVKSEKLGDILAALVEGGSVQMVLDGFAQDPPDSEIIGHIDEINQCFSQDNLTAVLQALKSGSDWCQSVAEKLDRLSPISMALTFQQMRMGQELDLRAALSLEYRIVSHLKKGHDFYEGVRAQLIDKDRNPQWSPATVDELDAAVIEAHFEEPDWGDLDLGAVSTAADVG